MNLIEQKMLDAYFDNPPACDVLVMETADHARVLGSEISRSPAWPAMQAIAMMTAEEKKRDAFARHQVRLMSEEFDVDAAERALDPALPVPRTLTASRLPETKRNAKPVRFTPREFRRRMDPVMLGMTKTERDERIAQMRLALRLLVDACDWDPSLEIVGPKIADQMLYMCERLAFNVGDRMRETAQQINATSRQTMNDEIPRQQLERLEWRQSGFRVQERHFQMMEHAFKAEREIVVSAYEGATDRSWGAYEGIKLRAERSARRYREKVRKRSALSMVIENMDAEEYARWVEKESRYEPRLDGVAASDDDAHEDMRGILTGYDGEDWGGGDQ